MKGELSIKTNILLRLKKLNKSIYWLEKTTKIDKRTLVRILNNEVEAAKFTTLDKIARAIDVSIDELFDREDHS